MNITEEEWSLVHTIYGPLKFISMAANFLQPRAQAYCHYYLTTC